MDDLTRLWTDLVGRLSGPMTFRLILQPLMATIYGIRDGITDAHDGRPPYFWSTFTEPEHARERLVDGARAVGRVLLLGGAMDVIYQFMVYRRLYPVELVLVVVILVFLPYMLIRGPANRVAHTPTVRQ